MGRSPPKTPPPLWEEESKLGEDSSPMVWLNPPWRRVLGCLLPSLPPIYTRGFEGSPHLKSHGCLSRPLDPFSTKSSRSCLAKPCRDSPTTTATTPLC